jgi:hypothetical protein
MEWKNDQEAYEYIGRFCVEFEQVCRSMETCVRAILTKYGLFDGSIQEILLSGHTAEPLRTLLQNLVGQTIVNTNDEQNSCNKIFKQIQDLVSKRNDIIHSKWVLVGQNNENEQLEIMALGTKLRANKKGVATKDCQLGKTMLETLIDQCREASIMMSLLTRCVMGIRNISDCFHVKNDKIEVKYEALKPV